jgi:hypothetical protein
MVMSELTNDSKRDGARIFGVIFQFLAFVSIAVTLYAMARIANLGNAFGVNPSNDPLIWFVLASGIFVTCVFMGMGYTLGILCAVYDRQESSRQVVTQEPATYGPKPPPLHRPASSVPRKGADPAPQSVADAVSRIPSFPIERQESEATEKGAFVEWLTRERHFRSPKQGR